MFFDGTIIPLFKEKGRPIERVVGTERANHASSLLVEFLETNAGEITVVLGSGDGTLHEIINALSVTELKGVRAGALPSKLHFVLVPCGTANALYHSFFKTSDKLKSVHAFLDGGRAVPLTLGITTLSGAPGKMIKPKGKSQCRIDYPRPFANDKQWSYQPWSLPPRSMRRYSTILNLSARSTRDWRGLRSQRRGTAKSGIMHQPNCSLLHPLASYKYMIPSRKDLSHIQNHQRMIPSSTFMVPSYTFCQLSM
jgi:hypothetical protein